MKPPRQSQLRDRFLREDQIVIEGRFAVSRALESGYQPELILTTKETLHALPPTPSKTVTEILSRLELSQISGYDFHRGCLALGQRPQPTRCLESALDRLNSNTAESRAHTVVLLERITDPQNLGAILRTAQALGVGQVFLSNECADPWSRRVIRTSMANVFASPPIISDDLFKVADHLAEAANVTLVAAALTEQALPIDAFRPPDTPLALMLGNEGDGLSRALLDRAHVTVKIPVRDVSDSLNVAVAAGILIDRLRTRRD